MYMGHGLKVGDRFIVLAKANRFYGLKGEILGFTDEAGIVSVSIDGDTQMVNISDLQKV